MKAIDFESTLLEHKDKLRFLSNAFLSPLPVEVTDDGIHGLGVMLDDLYREARDLHKYIDQNGEPEIKGNPGAVIGTLKDVVDDLGELMIANAENPRLRRELRDLLGRVGNVALQLEGRPQA